MHISFYFLYSLFTVYLVYGFPTSDVSTQFKVFTQSKCPSFETSIFAEEFIRNCPLTSLNAKNLKAWSEENENVQLCLMYFDTFVKFCEVVNVNLPKFLHQNVSKEAERIPSMFASEVGVVCNSLKTLNNPDLIDKNVLEELKDEKLCKRVCTNLKSEVKSVCSLTTFLWNSTLFLKKNHVNTAVTAEQSDKTNLASGNNLTTKMKKDDLAEQDHTAENTIILNPAVQNGAIDAKTNTSVIKESPIQNNRSVQVVDAVAEMTENVKLKNNSNITTKNVQLDNATPESVKKMQPIMSVSANNTELNLKETKASTENGKIVKNPVDQQETDNKINEGSSNEVLDENMDIDGAIETDGEDFDNEKEPRPVPNPMKNGEDLDNEKEPRPEPKPMKTKENVVSDPPVQGNDGSEDLQPKSSEVKSKPVEISKPREIDEDSLDGAVNYQNQNIDDSESYFFSYFMMVCVMFICGYVAYHNKQKILALVLEGRKGRRTSRTRRPNSANYRKLDSTLEEAVTSSCNKNTTQVIY